MSTSKAPAKSSSPRMTERQWCEAETLWASGNVTYDSLIAKYGKTKSAFERRFRKNGIVKGSAAAAIKKAAEKKVAESVISDATLIAARIKETKEEHYKMAAGLAKLVWSHILKTQQERVSVATATNDLKAIDAAMTVLKKAREERYAVLGLDRPDAVDPGDLPELVVSELTAEQIKELRDRDTSELDDISPTQEGDREHQSDSGDEDDDERDGVVEEGGS